MKTRRVSPIALLLFAALSAPGCSDADRAPTVQEVPLEAMQAAAEAATDDMAAFLSRTITYATVEPSGPGLLPETEALLDFVTGEARAMGFDVRRAAGGRVAVLEYGRGDEVVGALVHVDVVAPGDLAAWEHPPFAGEIADGKVFGRGAQDDKGALAGVLFGAKILIDEGMSFTRRLRIVLGTKEETDFGDMTAYFAEEAPPDFGIVPDGPFVVRAESGYADLTYSFPDLAPVAGERRRDTALYWSGGSAVNSVPDFSFLVLRSDDPAAARAEIESVIAAVTAEFTRGSKVPELSVVSWDDFARERDVTGVPAGDLVLFSRGQIAHSSVPASGRNAVVEVALVGARLTQLSPSAFTRAFAFVDQRIGLSTDGSGFGLATEKPIAAAADTTASLDLAITDAAAARLDLVINFRVGVANTVAEVESKSGDAAAVYGATVAPLGPTFDAYYYPDGDPLLDLVVGSYREVRGKDPVILALGSTTYVKAAPHLVSYGPVELAEDGLYFHTANEQLPVASLTRNAVLYAHVLQKLIHVAEAPRR
jgi:succinyl-diaminopimelate desuccinylase